MLERVVLGLVDLNMSLSFFVYLKCYNWTKRYEFLFVKWNGHLLEKLQNFDNYEGRLGYYIEPFFPQLVELSVHQSMKHENNDATTGATNENEKN